MKKNVAWYKGGSIEIDTNGQLFGFRAGDIISDAHPSSWWHSQRVIVEGFDEACEQKCIWGRIEGNSQSKCAISQNGLILLERPGRAFKVGDKVYISIWNEEGKVVAMNPYDSSTPYLVEYTADVTEHHAEPWFPKEYINLATKKIIWCSEKVLSLLL